MPLVSSDNERRCLLATDDRHPDDILEEGHIDFLVRRSIELGLSPMLAIRMATLNAAEYFGIERTGAIAPGYYADLVAFDSLKDLRPRRVYKRSGKLVAIDGKTIIPITDYQDNGFSNSVNIGELHIEDFLIKARGRQARIIELGKNQLYTEIKIDSPKIIDGQVVTDPEKDLLKITVVERHKASGRRGLGLVNGFGIKHGALAASIGHDSHNVIAVGADDRSICNAVAKVAQMQGGIAIVDGDRVEAALPLPIGGLLSNRPIEEVSEKVNDLKRASHRLGCNLQDPFMTMSFLALPVIPKLKITDRGLVDVSQFSLVDLFVDI
jgi:adenine deaminase